MLTMWFQSTPPFSKEEPNTETLGLHPWGARQPLQSIKISHNKTLLEKKNTQHQWNIKYNKIYCIRCSSFGFYRAQGNIYCEKIVLHCLIVERTLVKKNAPLLKFTFQYWRVVSVKLRVSQSLPAALCAVKQTFVRPWSFSHRVVSAGLCMFINP